MVKKILLQKKLSYCVYKKYTARKKKQDVFSFFMQIYKLYQRNMHNNYQRFISAKYFQIMTLILYTYIYINVKRLEI